MATDHLKDHQFKPGQSGCPGGLPKWWLTKGRVKDLISRIGSLPITKVQDIVDNPETPAMEAFIAKVYLKGIETGDVTRLNALLDRTIGRPVEVVEQTVHEGQAVVKSVSTDHLVELAKQAA